VVADAQPVRRRQLAARLREQGYAVREAHNGLEALLLVRRVLPAAAVLDPWLPTLPGPAVARALRRDPATRAIPVLAPAAPLAPQQAAEQVAALLAAPHPGAA
jgi:CheY-like chemotaxis protein